MINCAPPQRTRCLGGGELPIFRGRRPAPSPVVEVHFLDHHVGRRLVEDLKQHLADARNDAGLLFRRNRLAVRRSGAVRSRVPYTFTIGIVSYPFALRSQAPTGAKPMAKIDSGEIDTLNSPSWANASS